MMGFLHVSASLLIRFLKWDVLNMNDCAVNDF